jgi:hypothetical protein
MAQTVNLSNTTPAAATNAVNVTWQSDNSNPPNISAYVPSGVGGMPILVARSLLTAQSAAITATTIYAVPSSAAGFYRVNWVATITQAATTQSILGGSLGFQAKFTNGNGDAVVKTSNPTQDINANANTTGTTISSIEIAYCGASTNLQYLFDYMSAGGTVMNYDLAIVVEYLGA